MSNPICDYGCGQEGKYQFKSGKWCCSKSVNSCPAKKFRKLTPREKPELCDYGCGNKAIYKVNTQLGNEKWCCSKSINSCPSKKERTVKSNIGKKQQLAKPIETNELCSFGCEQKARFIYKNGSYCCSDDWHRCPKKKVDISERFKEIWSDQDRRERLSKNQRKDLIAKPIPVLDENKVCYYCGEKANFWFKTNNTYCCCDRIERCPTMRKQISDRYINLWKDENFRIKMMNSQDYTDPERLRKISESLKKWAKLNRNLVIKRAEKIGEQRRGKTWEEIMGEEKANKLKEKFSKERKGKTWEEIYGKERAEKIKRLNSKKLKGRKETREEVKKNMSEKKKEHWKDPNSSYNSKKFRKLKSTEGKKKWKDPDFIKKIQKGLHKSPNGPESKLIEILKELGLNYEFVGDWSISIDGRNPDFINYEKNKIIEHFGMYYHDTIVDLTKEEHEKERKEHFFKNGYETLIIWENELNDLEQLIKKIKQFDEKGI